MKKFIAWVKKTGFANLGLILAAVLIVILQPALWRLGATVCATLFVYINANVIWKLIKNKIK